MRNGVPVSEYDVTYDAAARAASRVAPGGVTVAYGYDGPLQTSMEWSGPVAGTVARTVDAALRPATERVNGADEVAFTFDPDGFIVAAGDLSIDRDDATACRRVRRSASSRTPGRMTRSARRPPPRPARTA